MSNKVIAIDIDNTVVDTGHLWNHWLSSRFKLISGRPISKQPYNLTELFTLPEDTDGFDFWRDPNLYNGLNPIEHSVEVLTKLSETYDIIFVSQAKGWHHKSKFKFIEKWFPFNKGLILTKEKNYVKCDYFIDDSLTQINNMPLEVDCLWLETYYVQSGVSPKRNLLQVKNWKEIETYFK